MGNFLSPPYLLTKVYLQNTSITGTKSWILLRSHPSISIKSLHQFCEYACVLTYTHTRIFINTHIIHTLSHTLNTCKVYVCVYVYVYIYMEYHTRVYMYISYNPIYLLATELPELQHPHSSSCLRPLSDLEQRPGLFGRCDTSRFHG